MNFDSFLKRCGIDASIHSVVMERETLLHMLEDLYTEGYNDGAVFDCTVKEYGSLSDRT